LIWWWDSFLQLDTERLKDFGPIPWGAIYNYSKVWGMTSPSLFDSFLFIIRGIDRVYLEEQSKKLDKGKS